MVTKVFRRNNGQKDKTRVFYINITGGKCLKDENGKTITGDENLKKRWKAYMEKLLNEENEWDEIIDVDKMEGPQQVITVEEVRKAIVII